MEINKIYCMDCIEGMKQIEDNSIDSIVTDPPYELGFMGKSWDNSGIAYNVEIWKEAFRVLKPGGHLLSFGGTRTYHRMACAIEDAGFEIRDQIQWIYGSGFPKSLNIGKALQKKGITNEEYNKYGTALKPAHEPIVVARKPLGEKTVAENVLKWGTGGINIDECRIEIDKEKETDNRVGTDEVRGEKNGLNSTSIFGCTEKGVQMYKNNGRFPANVIHDGSPEVLELFDKAGEVGNVYKGLRKKNTTSGTGFTLTGSKKEEGMSAGIYDGLGSAARFFYCAKASKSERNEGLAGGTGSNTYNKKCTVCGKWQLKQGLSDDYTCKCENPIFEKANGNFHPTVKPLKLMQYLVKLVTPKGGVCLDPFMGSGTTGMAAKSQGFRYIGFDMTKEYVEIAEARIANVVKQEKI